MFLPLGDTPNPRKFRPWITWSLIGLNVLVYVLVTLPLSQQAVDPQDPALIDYLRTLLDGRSVSRTGLAAILARTSGYDLFVFAHGYRPIAPSMADLFASLFLHSGFWHLGGNMLFLWIFGDNAEHRLGRLGYLVTYLGTGVAATLTYALFAGDSPAPLIGASGAISGVLGVYFLFFPRNRVKVFVALFPILFDVVLIPARLVLGAYVLIDNVLPFILSKSSNVAYGAHLGGFAAGLAVAWGVDALGWRLRRTPHARPSRLHLDGTGTASAVDPFAPAPPDDGRGTDLLGDLRASMAAGDRAGALQVLEQLRFDDLVELTPGECVNLAAWLQEQGYAGEAQALLRRCLATHRSSSDLARVYLALGLTRLEQGQPTAAYQHLLAVFDLDPDPETEAAARAALARIDVYRRRDG